MSSILNPPNSGKLRRRSWRRLVLSVVPWLTLCLAAFEVGRATTQTGPLPHSSCQDWHEGEQLVPHNPDFRMSAREYPELQDPRVQVLGPPSGAYNCFGLALYPHYRHLHPEGLYLSDRAAEIVLNTHYQTLPADIEPRRGDLVAYLQPHPDPAGGPPLQALVHLGVVWTVRPGERGWRLDVLSKFDRGPLCLAPLGVVPNGYQYTRVVVLRRRGPVGELQLPVGVRPPG